jgi:prolyl-tRNA synthetase
MNTYRNSFIYTLKEAPNDAEVISHQLMLRAGMIRKIASGVYSILPLGQRVFNKLNRIIREEMIAIGGAECALPHVVPAELWKSSGRWDQYGKELLRLNDRSDREFCFGPTHEEVITDLVKGYVNSYKQLPVMLYQIQTKFRDEIRPRFGLMRGREFLMKDAYSFHDSEACLQDHYDSVRKAYSTIFSRCGLSFIEARADSGAIGGDESAEFLVIADSGEDEVLVSDSGFAANVEAAACSGINVTHDISNIEPLTMVDTPNVHRIDDAVDFFSVSANQTLKSLLVVVNDVFSLVCLRGDHALNASKAAALLGGAFRFATDAEIQAYCGCKPGSIGPINLKLNIPIYLDHSLNVFSHYICGANQTGAHFQFCVPQRDIPTFVWADLRNAQAGDPCPLDSSNTLVSQRGIEVGHVFKLGNKYSESMGAKFTQRDGQLKAFEMGCYGIGVGRTIAAAIEQSHDEHGIVWPEALAPYDVVILNLVPKEPELVDLVKTMVAHFETMGKDVIVDDRVESPGVKFKDADLIGFPMQVIVGKKTLLERQIEIKYRRTKKKEMVSVNELGAISPLVK